MSRWLGIAVCVVVISLGSQVGADQVTVTGTLSHDSLSDPDVLGLDGASFAFVSGVAPDALPESSGTQPDPNGFDHASYLTVGSFAVTGSAGGAADGNYFATGFAIFRSPLAPGPDWIEISGYPNALASDAVVRTNVYFADNSSVPGDPLDFFAFSSGEATVTGSLDIGGGIHKVAGGVHYDLLSPTAIGTLPEADAPGLGAAVLLALAARRRRR